MNLRTVHAIVVYFLSNFIFKQSIYYRMSMQNSRTIALELILGLWLWWGSGGVSRSGKLAGSGKLTVGYVINKHSYTERRPAEILMAKIKGPISKVKKSESTFYEKADGDLY